MNNFPLDPQAQLLRIFDWLRDDLRSCSEDELEEFFGERISEEEALDSIRLVWDSIQQKLKSRTDESSVKTRKHILEFLATL
jgi:hypothetical protein